MLASRVTLEDAQQRIKEAIAIAAYLAEGGHTKADAAQEFRFSKLVIDRRLETLRYIHSTKYYILYLKAMEELKKANKAVAQKRAKEKKEIKEALQKVIEAKKNTDK